MSKSKIRLKSIGCRTNQEEMLSLSALLVDAGYTIVDKNIDADIIIVNTCTVTGETESKTGRLIKSLARAAPGAKILVTGCLAQQLPEKLLKIHGVCWVVGNVDKMNIPDILEGGNKGIYHTPMTKNILPVCLFDSPVPDCMESSRTRFAVKIQEGCDFRCAYCIVPYLRGYSRSVEKSRILSVCKKAVLSGYKELILTGTHIGQYTYRKNYRLVDLIDDILNIKGNFRLRLSSLDPRDCTGEILQRIIHEEKLCRHIHVSVQSLCSEVVKRMNRFYKGYESFIDRMIQFHNACPDAGIGGDFIVGFPGETGRMFETNLELVKEVGFNYGHVFRYSMRPGTPAASMDKQVDKKNKVKRSRILRECLSMMRSVFVNKQVDTAMHEIIVEQEKPTLGITSNYIRVQIPNFKTQRNTWLNVRLKSYLSEKNLCIAEPFSRSNKQ